MIELTAEERAEVTRIAIKYDLPLHEVWERAKQKKQGWYYQLFQPHPILKRVCWNCGVPLKKVTRKGDTSYFQCPQCKNTVKIQFDC